MEVQNKPDSNRVRTLARKIAKEKGVPYKVAHRESKNLFHNPTNRKLTPEQVKSARREWKLQQPRATVKILAHKYGVSYTAMHSMLRRATYFDVN